MEVEPVVKIEVVNAIRFVRSNILYRFRVLKVLVMDNRNQFDSQAFKDLCKEFIVQQCFSSRSYSHVNCIANQATK